LKEQAKETTMSTIPTVTEQTICDLVGEQSFQRGQRYFQSDALFDMQWQGMTLKARCQGSRSTAYRVNVTFNDAEITEAGCSCPIRGYCKHVAAVLLAWQAHPEEFLEYQDLETILEQCDKADLINLIKHMVQRDDDLEPLVRTMVRRDAPVDPQFYHHQVESAFRRGGNSLGSEADELEAIRESAGGFAQRHDYASAIAAYEAIVAGIIKHYFEYDHESQEFQEIVNKCVEELEKWLVDGQGNSTLREQIFSLLFTIFHFSIRAGHVTFGRWAPSILLEQTSVEERQTLARWVREAIDTRKQAASRISYHTRSYHGFSFEEEVVSETLSYYGTRRLGKFLLELEADTLDDEAYLHICRETGRVSDLVERLLELQRVDEVVQEAQHVNDYELLGIADLLVKAGQEAIAQDLIQKRAWKMQDKRLLEWLKEHSVIQDESANKLVQVEKQFQEQPTIEGYQEIRCLAAQIGQWARKRPEFLTFLRKNQHTELLIQIALDEDDTDEILKLVQAAGSPIKSESIDRIIELVATAEETQPDVALHFYQRYVAYIISHRNRQAYELASRFLIKIRALYEKLGKDEVWTRYIARLYERNSNLRALKNVLVAARLVDPHEVVERSP